MSRKITVAPTATIIKKYRALDNEATADGAPSEPVWGIGVTGYWGEENGVGLINKEPQSNPKSKLASIGTK
jgi:hypothetical protein